MIVALESRPIVETLIATYIKYKLLYCAALCTEKIALYTYAYFIEIRSRTQLKYTYVLKHFPRLSIRRPFNNVYVCVYKSLDRLL